MSNAEPKNPFDTDKELIDYCKSHSLIPRALFVNEHLAYLVSLAGGDRTFMSGGFTECNKDEMDVIIQAIYQNREDLDPSKDPKFYRKCLDHGYVRLVDHMGSDLSIVRAARVSYNAEWRTGKDAGKDEALLKYMLKHRHTTPFEHVTFQFEVKAPIFVFRQWHRHRTQSYNEFSARYSELKDEFYVPRASDIGIPHPTSKQQRIVGSDLSSEELRRLQNDVAYQANTCSSAFNTYRDLLDAGWPRELARGHLPVSTYSKMYVTVDLHNLMHFLGLRMDEHAQYEIRVYAEAMHDMVSRHVPVAMKLWDKYVLNMPTIKSVREAIEGALDKDTRSTANVQALIDLITMLKEHE